MSASSFHFHDMFVKNIKIIPQNYLINSEKNRLKLLAGIVDSDGHLSKRNHLEITSKLETLANQYCFLARSLGLAAYKSKKRTSIRSLNYKGIAYRVTISGDLNRIPTKIPRKQASLRKQIKRVNVTGFNLEPLPSP